MAGAPAGVGESPLAVCGPAGDRGARSLQRVACVLLCSLLEILVRWGNPCVFHAGETDRRLQEGSWYEPGKQLRLSWYVAFVFYLM